MSIYHFPAKGKIRDPRWLKMDVCRDHTRGNKCERGESLCRFAHPDDNCVITNGKVTACYDSMKSRCNREACKFYHPPEHIKKNIQALGKAFEQQRFNQEQHGMLELGPEMMPLYLHQLGKGKMSRRIDYSDKLPVCDFYLNKSCKKTEDDCQFAHPPSQVQLEADGFVTVCMDFVADHCERGNCKYFHPPIHLKARVKAAQLRHAPPMATTTVGDNGAITLPPPLVRNQLYPMVGTSRPQAVLPSTFYQHIPPPVFFYNAMPAPQVAYPLVHDHHEPGK
eukprot:gene7747-8588_t